MSWDWLFQIFRGEGEVVDVFVSHKRRRTNGSYFGFVWYKKLEEAMNALRNLNGIKVRGKALKVAFSKYDKNGKMWSSQVNNEESKGARSVGNLKGSNGDFRDGRSFKEVVEGLSQYLDGEDKEANGLGKAKTPYIDKDQRHLDFKCLEGLVGRLVDVIFNPTISEEVKQKYEIEIAEALNMFLRGEDAMFGSCMQG